MQTRTIVLLEALMATAAVAGCGDDADEARRAASPAAAHITARVVDYERPEGPAAREGLLVIDPKTGESQAPAAPGFSGGDAQFAFVASPDRIAYRCSRGACLTGLGADAQETRLGEAWCIAPSVRAAHVWLAVLDPESPPTERAIASVSEVDFRGQVRTGPSTLPSRRWHCPVGAYEGGLLFQQESGIAAWDARSSKIIATIPDTFPAAVDEGVVATYPDESESKLRITDLKTGRETLIVPPSGWRFNPSYEGDFSPDGSHVAVTASRSDARKSEHGIAVVDLSTGSAETAPLDWVAGIAWASDGAEIYVATLDPEGRYDEAIAVYDAQLNMERTLDIGLGILELEVPAT